MKKVKLVRKERQVRIVRPFLWNSPIHPFTHSFSVRSQNPQIQIRVSFALGRKTKSKNQATNQARRPFAKATLNRFDNGGRMNGKNLSCK